MLAFVGPMSSASTASRLGTSCVLSIGPKKDTWAFVACQGLSRSIPGLGHGYELRVAWQLGGEAEQKKKRALLPCALRERANKNSSLARAERHNTKH